MNVVRDVVYVPCPHTNVFVSNPIPLIRQMLLIGHRALNSMSRRSLAFVRYVRHSGLAVGILVHISACRLT